MTMLRSLGLLVVLQTTSDAYLLNHPSFASSSSWGTSCRGASCPARRIRQTRPYYLAPPTASSSIINNTSAAVFSTDPLLFDMQKQYAELHECMEQTLQLEASSQKSTAKQQVINRARWLLLIAAALYGTNFSCVKLLGEADIPIGASTTLRFGLAALVTLPWLVPSTRKESLRVDCPDIAATMAGLEVGMWNSMGYIAQAVGLQTTAASKSAFLCSLAVVVVPLLDAMAGKVMKSKQITGVVLALAGVAMLELGGSMQDVNFAPGDWCSLLQPLAFGMGFWRMEAAMHKYPNQALRSTAAQLFAVFVASFAYCMCAEQGAFAHTQEWLTDPTIFLGLFWTGVITTALTIYMETIALETLSAAETTLIFSTEPLFGTAFAAAVMGEQLGLDSAIGAILIVSGCLFSNIGIEGVKAFFRRGEGGGESPRPSLSPVSHLALLRASFAAAVTSSATSVLNSMSVATKLAAIQVQDALEDVFPWLD